jgi:hypothetical protein
MMIWAIPAKIGCCHLSETDFTGLVWIRQCRKGFLLSLTYLMNGLITGSIACAFTQSMMSSSCVSSSSDGTMSGLTGKLSMYAFGRIVTDGLYRFYVLYREVIIGEDRKRQLVLPTAHIQPILEALHDDMGHPGKDRMLSLIRGRLYWPDMDTAVEEWISQCLRNAIMNYKVVKECLCCSLCCLVPSWHSLSISSKVVCDNQDVMMSAFRLLKS